MSRSHDVRAAMLGAAGRLLLALAIGAGCTGARDGDRPPLVVFAAASLTDVFADLEAGFEAAEPDAELSISFAGSQVLRLQIEQGAPADLFASANQRHMDALVRSGLVVDSRVFAGNRLVVIVPLDNPAGIERFADLARARRVVLGAPNVPIGGYSRELLRRAGQELGPGFEREVLDHVVSEETNVRMVRAKVELGEADAAIVYRTDAFSSKRVRTIPIPDSLAVPADYFIGRVARSNDGELARRWVDYVLSAAGRDILRRHGFVTEP